MFKTYYCCHAELWPSPIMTISSQRCVVGAVFTWETSHRKKFVWWKREKAPIIPKKNSDSVQKPSQSEFGLSSRGTYLGMITESITWMTPFLQSMSVLTTVAPSIITLPSTTLIATFCPLAVFADVSLTTSAAITLPGTTW